MKKVTKKTGRRKIGSKKRRNIKKKKQAKKAGK